MAVASDNSMRRLVSRSTAALYARPAIRSRDLRTDELRHASEDLGDLADRWRIGEGRRRSAARSARAVGVCARNANRSASPRSECGATRPGSLRETSSLVTRGNPAGSSVDRLGLAAVVAMHAMKCKIERGRDRECDLAQRIGAGQLHRLQRWMCEPLEHEPAAQIEGREPWRHRDELAPRDRRSMRGTFVIGSDHRSDRQLGEPWPWPRHEPLDRFLDGLDVVLRSERADVLAGRAREQFRREVVVADIFEEPEPQERRSFLGEVATEPRFDRREPRAMPSRPSPPFRSSAIRSPRGSPVSMSRSRVDREVVRAPAGDQLVVDIASVRHIASPLCTGRTTMREPKRENGPSRTSRISKLSEVESSESLLLLADEVERRGRRRVAAHHHVNRATAARA